MIRTEQVIYFVISIFSLFILSITLTGILIPLIYK